MLRVAHTGDLHLPEGPRFGDVFQCLQFVVDDGIAQGVGLWLVGGDLSGTVVPHVATVMERNGLDILFQQMADHAPVVIAYGNHDAPGDLEGYARLHARHPIYVVSEPTALSVAGVMVFVLPYPLKRVWSKARLDTIDAEDRAVEQDLQALFRSWRRTVEHMHDARVAIVFLGHVTIGGCAIAGGEVMPAGQEIEVSVTDLQQLGCDYSGASHIHLSQEMAPGIWYAGSPSRSNFGETDPKGYLVVDVEAGRPPVVHRRLTPARRFVTIDATWNADRQQFLVGDDPIDQHLAVDGAEVRCRLSVPADALTACPKDELAARFAIAGAVDVKMDTRAVPTERLRSEAILTARTTAQKLAAYWSTLADNAPDAETQARCLQKLGAIEAGAVPVEEGIAA